ncbi:MAG: response regulator [Ignavibacteriaceae bacterium]
MSAMKDKIRVIIIDDESLARSITRKYLSDRTEFEIIAECSNGLDAIKKINEEKPDIVFLDIQMPKMTGFEMLELLEDPPIIIFTTAYDHYAIKAFEVNAVDYLLKPFSEDRFNEALEKTIVHLKEKTSQSEIIKNLIEKNDENVEFIERVIYKDGQKINIVPTEKIRWLEAQDDYVMVHTENNKFLKLKTMKYFERHLDPSYFVRIHRSYIISIDSIKHLEQSEKDSYKIILKNNQQLPVSKTGLSKLKNIL